MEDVQSKTIFCCFAFARMYQIVVPCQTVWGGHLVATLLVAGDDQHPEDVKPDVLLDLEDPVLHEVCRHHQQSCG